MTNCHLKTKVKWATIPKISVEKWSTQKKLFYDDETSYEVGENMIHTGWNSRGRVQKVLGNFPGGGVFQFL